MPQHTLRTSAPRPTPESAIEHVVACAPALDWRPADPLNADADAPKALTSPTSGSLRADAASVRPSPNSLSSVLASHPAAPLTSSPPPTARSSCRAPGLPACCCSAAGASLLPCHSSSHLPRRCRRPATAACFPCRPGCHGVSAHAIIASI